MKFKIDSQFQDQVRAALKALSIPHHLIKKNDSQCFILQVHQHFQLHNQTFTPQICHTIGQSLLLQFHKQQKVNRQKCGTINEWLKQYKSQLDDLDKQNKKIAKDQKNIKIDTSLGKNLLKARLSILRQKIRNQKQKLAHLLKEYYERKSTYNIVTQSQSKRLKLSLQNISLRLDIGQSNEESENSKSEEYERINKLIKNGLWGYLPRLSEKIDKIQVLQQQIKQLRQLK